MSGQIAITTFHNKIFAHELLSTKTKHLPRRIGPWNMSDVLGSIELCLRLAFGIEANEFYFKQKKFKFHFFMSVTSPSE